MGENQEFRQITLAEWLYWKEDIRDKLRETAGNFVYIGYRLKQIRDSGMFDGAADVFEFAQREYGLGKSTVSRFIAINEKFSEGGNSLELKAEFREIGSSKLAEMLTLPDAECSLITERTTVKEIRDLKSFLRQQPSEESQETAGLEEPDGEPAENNAGKEKRNGEAEAEHAPNEAIQGEGGAEREESSKIQEKTEGEDRAAELTPLGKCMVEYFRDQKELLNDVIPLVYESKYEAAAELMNPSGYGTYRKGLVYLFMYDFSQGVKYKVFGRPEVPGMTWDEFLLQIYDIYANLYEAGENDVHGAFYREPEKEEVQEQPEEPEKESGKAAAETLPEEPEKELQQGNEKASETSKILESAPSVATSQQPQKSEDKAPDQTEEIQQEEQLPGQMEVQDYPELLPESSHIESAENQKGNGEEDAREESNSGNPEMDGEESESDGETTAEEPDLDEKKEIREEPGQAPGSEERGPEPEAAENNAASAGGGTANCKVQEPDTGHGTAESGGCETDPWTDIKRQGYIEVWKELAAAEKGVSRFIWSWKDMAPTAFPREYLEEAYRDAIDLAAALEKLMIVRDADGEVDNA